MQLSWFPKPIYRIVLLFTIPALVGCGCLIFFTSSGWLLLAIIAVISATILIGSSFIVCSGVYVTTICKGNARSNKIALTFDDGPCAQTKDILQVLDKHQVKASFFLIGQNVALNIDIAYEISQKGHTIGNHSYYHKSWFPIIGAGRIKKELIDTQNIITLTTSKKPIYFRPPFGITNPLIAKALKNFNFKTIGWSVRSLDTVTDNPDRILTRIKNKISPGSIILMHDTTKNAALVLEQLLIYCKQKNLEPVNLEKLLEE
jgi:peptidoglycan-N-acetylglucosamine deacetylase